MNTIGIFAGSIRSHAKSAQVAEYVASRVDVRKEMRSELISLDRFPADFETEGKSAAPMELTKLLKSVDGFIIVSPEYNHGYPGSLKYLLDMHLTEYIHKPVGLVGVSSGTFGGVRAIQQLVPVVRELGMIASFTDLKVGHVGDTFSDSTPVDEETWNKRVNEFLDELEWLMHTLQYGRDHFKSKYHEA